MLAGMILWAIFVAMDARFDKQAGFRGHVDAAQEDKFSFKDVLRLLKNKEFIMIALLCVFFYSSIVSFKKFASAILIPRFEVPVEAASWMVSMLPFATVIFAPLFGIMVDKAGKGTRWMVLGAILAFIAHMLLAFAPAGRPIFGYLSMIFLGFGYSLVPAAMWPGVPKIVPDKVLGTAYSLIYWVPLLSRFTGKYTLNPVKVELMFVGVCIVSILLSVGLAISSGKHPEYKLDAPSGK